MTAPTQSEKLLPEGWPAMSLAEATARLCAPGSLYEMETISIRGRPVRTWRNQPRNLAALARSARERFSSNEFIVLGEDRVTYEGWYRAVAALAAALQAEGIGRGDRVAIAMRNLPEFPVALFAIGAIGAIAVPLNAWWEEQELLYGLSDSGSSLLICDMERWQRIAGRTAELPALRTVWVARAATDGFPSHVRPLEALIGSPGGYGDLPEATLPEPGPDPEDPASIFYTSGTTGSPKGALGTHRNMLNTTLSGSFTAQRRSLRRGIEPPAAVPGIALLVIPLFHVTACNSTLMSTIMSGSKLILMHKWNPVEAMQLIERERIKSTGGVPTIAWQLLEHPDRSRYDLSSLEAVSYGGAPAAPELVRRLAGDLAAAPGNGWGMTETSSTVTVHIGEDYINRPESCGPALPVSDLRIVAEDGETILPAGEVGELWVYGPQVVAEYWNKPEASAATFVDGWVRTGDLARLDDEGFCYIVDRLKDVIIRGGENIYSSEIENRLFEHPGVADAAVVGIAHRTLGEEPAAVVQLAPGHDATEADLQKWVRDRLAAFKVPVAILFSDTPLPRNANGKILKRDLHKLFEDRGA